ncbi:MAG: HPr family phosphocarrier protein [Clostridia bacterium]|nr:HPr family phosphocarrier protein [Clostridia bacterium]
MIDINVKLNTMNDVKEFCSILSGYSFDAQLASGGDIVNAKSIIGIFSLNLKGNTVLSVDTQNLLDLPEKIYKYMA